MFQNPFAQEFQALLDAAVDAIVVIDHAGVIQSFNRSAERLFGYPAAEVIGHGVGLLMNKEDRGTHDAHLQRYIATRVPHIIGTGREVRARRRNGHEFPAFLSVGATGSDPPRFVGFVRDMSGTRQAEIEARRLQERLMHVSRLATIGEMASGIAHELNQPLAAMATYAQACKRLLDATQPEIDEVQMALAQIADQAVRAGDIIKKMRALARAGDSQPLPTDLNSVIEELTDLIRSDARAHGVEYRRELAPDLPPVLVDRAQIQQVVLNLVRNALEAFALGQLDAAQVIITTRRTESGDVDVSVRDNGPGVDPRVIDRLFEPFCSTKATGTGLGLPMSRTIVGTLGGTLDYRPASPRGACFIVSLPALRD